MSINKIKSMVFMRKCKRKCKKNLKTWAFIKMCVLYVAIIKIKGKSMSSGSL